jgi:hypothetical protein
MKYILTVLTITAFASCTIDRRIYSPTQINNPSLREKNDHSFSLSYSTPAGFDFSGGYAITNRLAMIGGAYSYRNDDHQTASNILYSHSTTADLLYKHQGLHGGLGLYFPLSKNDRTMYASFFTGYYMGDFRMDEHNVLTSSSNPGAIVNDYFYNSNIGRYFLQGAFNAFVDRFEISFLTRYNYVTYSNVTTNYSELVQTGSCLPPVGYSKNSQFLDVGGDAKYFFSKDGRLGLTIFGNGTVRLNRKDYNFEYYDYRLGFGLVFKNPFKRK